jgi:hypothetical protein
MHSVTIDERSKCIHLFVYFSLDGSISRVKQLAFVRRLNEDVSMGKFSISGTNELHVYYDFPYQHGLFGEQLLGVLNDFVSMLAHLVDEKTDRDGLILHSLDCFFHKPDLDAIEAAYMNLKGNQGAQRENYFEFISAGSKMRGRNLESLLAILHTILRAIDHKSQKGH